MAAKKDKADDKNKKEDDKDEQDVLGGSEDGDAVPAEGDAAAAAGKAKFSKKKILLFGGALVVLLIAIGAGLYFSGVLDGLLGKTAECAEGDEECEKAKAAAAHGEDAEHGEDGAAAEEAHTEGAFLPIPTMIVNLSSDDGVPRYLRLTVHLELKSEEDLKAVELVIPRVIDQFQTYLRELRVKDLRGSAGIYRLQMELLWRVNQAAKPVEVKDVLFQEILIQ